MKKKIVFIDQTLGSGGAERVLCTFIRSLDSRLYDIECVIITGEGQLTHLLPDYVKLDRLYLSSTKKALFALVNHLNKCKPDIVFCTSSRVAVLMVMARYYTNRFRLIARYPSMPSAEISTGAVKGWRLWLTKLVYRYVDHVIAQTDEMAEDLISIYKLNPQKVSVVMNPVDTKYIDCALLEQNNPFSEQGINIIAVGTLYPVKGYDVLIKAFKIISRDRSSLRLHFIGKDKDGYRKALEHLIEDLKLNHSVKFWGHQNNPYRFIQHTDLLVLPSRREGLPNVLLEANYIGCKSVATNCVPVISRLLKQEFVVEVDDEVALAKAISEALGIDGRGEVTNKKFNFSTSDLNRILVEEI